VTRAQLEAIEQRVVQPTLDGLRRDGAGFVGCLYPGLMIEGESVHVVEFNARFGDPEAQTYMRLLDGDLFEILMSCAEGRLDPAAVAWKPGICVSVALASAGYPDQASAQPDVVVFHAGTVRANGLLETSGGRVLYVTAVGDDLADARTKAYRAIGSVEFDGMHFRTDIGLRPLPGTTQEMAHG
jgi:phosphoribosylamine--glycine ligase